MSLSPGVPKRPAAGTVVLQHGFTDQAQSTIVALAPDVTKQGANVFKAAATTEAATVINQNDGHGVIAAPTDDSGYHTYNVGYPGDRDVSLDITLAANFDKVDLFYKCDGKDTTDDGLGFIVRVERRDGTPNVIRYRFRSALTADGVVSGRTPTGSQDASYDVEVADGSVEFTLLIEDRANLGANGRCTYYMDGVQVDYVDYTAADRTIIDGTIVHTDGTTGRRLVEVGFLGKNANVLLDNLIVTNR